MSGPVRTWILSMMILLAADAASAACSPQRPAANANGAPSRDGVTVTKEVPSSKETVGEIQERESKEPPRKQQDRAIHPHRIPRDNNSVPAPGTVPDNSTR